jgi:ABC-type lipoprotein export system ATPase subunit
MSPEPSVVEIEDCRVTLDASSPQGLEFHLAGFHMQPGEQVALTGPSGCGKSTLLNLIAGLRRTDGGTLRIQGTDLAALSPAKLDSFRGRTMGFVFQSFNLLESFSALENVLIGMSFGRSCPRSERHQRAVELLDRVGLSQRLDHSPSRLSVGERQRVAIARALANRPALLLADEPTGALDPATAEDIFNLIREVCEEESRSLILVTHDHSLAARLPRQLDCRGLVGPSKAKEVAK